MATERQIAANRANSKKSTGPKTTAGKRRSSRNAFRHGLSGPLPEDRITLAMIDAIARAVARGVDGESRQTTAFARSQLELRRIREVRNGLISGLISESLDPRALRRLAALDRYERLARTKCRRAKGVLANSATCITSIHRS
jgi:hypothetical protein